MTEKQYYKEKGVSSSSLKWFEISPKYFKRRLDEEIADEKRSWLELGKKVHMAILEPDEFEKNYIYLEYTQPSSPNQKKFCEEYVDLRKKHPKATKKSHKKQAYSKSYNVKGKKDDAVEKEADKLYKKLKDYIDYLEKRDEYKDILTKADWDKILELKEETYIHKAAKDIMALDKDPFDTNIEAFSELAIFWYYPDTDLQCKSMLDRVVIDHNEKVIRLIDVKTTSKIGDFKDSFEDFKYYRQLAFYWMALFYELEKGSMKDKVNLDEYKKESYILTLNTRDFPEARLYKIPEHKLDEGLSEIDKLISDIKWHFDNEVWNHTREYYENDGIENLY